MAQHIRSHAHTFMTRLASAERISVGEKRGAVESLQIITNATKHPRGIVTVYCQGLFYEGGQGWMEWHCVFMCGARQLVHDNAAIKKYAYDGTENEWGINQAEK